MSTAAGDDEYDEQYDRAEARQRTDSQFHVIIIVLLLLVLIAASVAALLAGLALGRQRPIKHDIIDEVGECTEAGQNCTDVAGMCVDVADTCVDAIYNNTADQGGRFDDLQTCACPCIQITQAMLNPATSTVFTANGCYELAESLVWTGFGNTAISFARNVVGTLDGRGHSITLQTNFARAVAIGPNAHFTVRDVVVIKSSVFWGQGVSVLQNATAMIINLRCNGTGQCLDVRARSATTVRGLISDTRYDTQEWVATWGGTHGYLSHGILAVDATLLDVDGVLVRAVDRDKELRRPPSFLQWHTRGIYISASSASAAPVLFTRSAGNGTKAILRNVILDGAQNSLSASIFDTLVFENVEVICGDTTFETCVELGSTISSNAAGSVHVNGMVVSTGALRPDAYNISTADAFWYTPMVVFGVRAFHATGLHVTGRGGKYYDPTGIVGFGPLVRRHPLLLIDFVPWCFPAFGCSNAAGDRSVVIRDSSVTALDDATVGIIIGMGSGAYGANERISATLDNVRVRNGSIGVLMGSRVASAQLQNVKIDGSYYGAIIANGTSAVIVQDTTIQHTCRPYWVQGSARYNLLQRVECTVNGETGVNDNPTDNTLTAVNDRFVQGACGPAPDLFEIALDFAPYANFVGVVSVNENPLLSVDSVFDHDGLSTLSIEELAPYLAA
jgi:hypothetical protein